MSYLHHVSYRSRYQKKHVHTYMYMYQIRSDQSFSHVRLFMTPWIAARQASLSITNSRSSLRLMSCIRLYICIRIYLRLYIFTAAAAAAAAKSLQSCPTLWDPTDGSPPGSPVPGILQARTLEWVAISFSKAGKWKVKVKSLSRVQLLATPWTAAYQAPPSMGFSRQEYWSGVPLPSPYIFTNYNNTYIDVDRTIEK